jgi:hypothetical protein
MPRIAIGRAKRSEMLRVVVRAAREMKVGVRESIASMRKARESSASKREER